MILFNLRRKLSLIWSLPFSIFFNLYYLPFRQAIRVPIILYHPTFWTLAGKVIIDTPKICFGMIRLGLFNASVNNEKGFVWSNEGGTAIFHGRFAAGPGSVLKISQPGAILEFGDGVNNTSGLKIDCNYHITIGDKVRLGWGVIMMDSSLHRLKNPDGSWVGKGYDAIEIGENTWISTQCIVLKGTRFPSYSVAAFGSLLNKDYSKGEKGIYAGRPAVFKRKGYLDMADSQIVYDGNF